ncbi:MAG: hypothetical protein Q8O24_07510 [Gallionellaceae bacterium]|nr:hypothetical protein [Gallionellaceae bacterium]
MPKKRLLRPRIQRAFVRWFNENRTRFEVPIRLTRITANGVELRFQNYPDCLSVRLSSKELNVHVKWQGQWWDMLISLDAWVFHTPGGYKCNCCWDDSEEPATIFPSREALWQDHLFDPFLKWVNEKLAPARWLQISGAGDGGCTWAQLIRDESELDKPDRTLILLQGLKRIDGTPAYDGGEEGVTNWLIPLKAEAS